MKTLKDAPFNAVCGGSCLSRHGFEPGHWWHSLLGYCLLCIAEGRSLSLQNDKTLQQTMSGYIYKPWKCGFSGLLLPLGRCGWFLWGEQRGGAMGHCFSCHYPPDVLCDTRLQGNIYDHQPDIALVLYLLLFIVTPPCFWLQCFLGGLCSVCFIFLLFAFTFFNALITRHP